MAVLRIVPNLAASNPAKARAFYGALLGLDVAMDMGWIMTFASNAAATPQISVATELCHEYRRSKRRCVTIREMKVGPSGSAIRSRSQATASCCGQKPR
jgi:hypothetical protein